MKETNRALSSIPTFPHNAFITRVLDTAVYKGSLSPSQSSKYVFLSLLPFELRLYHSLKTMFPNAWPLKLLYFPLPSWSIKHCFSSCFILWISFHECLFLPMPIHLCCDFFYVEASQKFYLQHLLLPNISPLAISFAPKTSAMPLYETIQMSISQQVPPEL